MKIRNVLPRGLVGLVLIAMLAACASVEPLPITCDERQMLCYRGFVIDRSATRSRFGAAGDVRINQDNL